MSRKGKITTVLLVILFVVLPCCIFGYFYFGVYSELANEAAKRIEEGAIDRVVASESPVYYDDGLTPIGVFFEQTHLRYIPYEDIPKVFIKAIIAAEDKNFFKHQGFDVKAVIRAFWTNYRAGKVKQGGSTITQQTAKNVFKREKRSYKAKFKELVQALVLEKKFTKEKILETYINQFFVTGYGKGLRIAAQYFFAKEPADLDLVEAAFIAGSVKAPNRYNPFAKKTKEEKLTAIGLARQRKDYVLDNMLKMNAITKEEYEKAKKREVPFKEGKITYRLNVVLDYIREQLESDYFKAILREQGVENIATSGISIHTSINKEIQEAALKSLRRHLPILDVKMNGYDINEIVNRSKEQVEDQFTQKSESLPFLAKISHVDSGKEGGYLKLTWDNGDGVIDYVLTFFNNSLGKITGYSPEELMGLNYRQYSSQKTSENMFMVFNRVFSETQPIMDACFEIELKSGKALQIELSAAPIFDNDDRVIGFRGLMRDVSEKKKAELENKIEKFEPRDVKAIQERISKLNETNSSIRTNQEHIKLKKEIAEKSAEYSAGLTRMNAIDGEKIDVYRDAEMPVAGLEVGEEDITFPDPSNGERVSFGSLSSGQKIRVSVSILAKFLPPPDEGLRCMVINDANSLDKDNYTAMLDAANRNNIQLLMHKTAFETESNRLEIIIEGSDKKEEVVPFKEDFTYPDGDDAGPFEKD